MTRSSETRVAYLVNRYPAISHAFIRREIEGVEAAGVEVLRYSMRPVRLEDLADSEDRSEHAKTAAILAARTGLAVAMLWAMLRHPIRWFHAFATAWRCGAVAGGMRLRHLVYLAEACWLARRLRAQRVDHLHAHFGTNAAMVALLCRMLGGPPYSFTVHGPEEFDRPEALSLRAKAAGAKFVVAISDYGRAQLLRWIHPGTPVHVVRCGVDSAFLGDSAPPIPASPTIVCVGRLCTDKSQVRLVEAAAELVHDGVQFRLTLVGDGPQRSEIERAIDRHHLQGRVEIKGWADSAGVREAITSASILALPSVAEGLPVVIMEALALGRPVVSTYVAGIPELVVPGVTGWLVPAGNTSHLVAVLRDAVRTPTPRLREMGEAGRMSILARHVSTVEAGHLVRLFFGGST